MFKKSSQRLFPQLASINKDGNVHVVGGFGAGVAGGFGAAGAGVADGGCGAGAGPFSI